MRAETCLKLIANEVKEWEHGERTLSGWVLTLIHRLGAVSHTVQIGDRVGVRIELIKLAAVVVAAMQSIDAWLS